MFPRFTHFRAAFDAALLLLAAASACGGCGMVRSPIDPRSRLTAAPATSPAARRFPHFDHVLIVVLENRDYEEAMLDPYLASLARDGANLTDYHGLFHPSYSNYLALVAGKEFPTFFDGQIDAGDPTIGQSLEAAGLTWKNYAEGYPTDPKHNPTGCFTGSTFGPTRYARKHVPFLSFTRVQAAERRDPGRHVAPGYELGQDLARGAVPNYAFYSPNVENDGHDTSLPYASEWLRSFLEPLRHNAGYMKNGLIVVTFDESAGTVLTPRDPNHIYTVLLGGHVQPGACAQPSNHYNLLRTIEDNFRLNPLSDGDGGARPITGVWSDENDSPAAAGTGQTGAR